MESEKSSSFKNKKRKFALLLFNIIFFVGNIGFYIKERSKWIYERSFIMKPIIKSIANNITQELVKDVLAGKEISFVNHEKDVAKDLVISSDESNMLEIGHSNTKVFLGEGDNKIILKIVNNISICSIHVEQIKQTKKVA